MLNIELFKDSVQLECVCNRLSFTEAMIKVAELHHDFGCLTGDEATMQTASFLWYGQERKVPSLEDGDKAYLELLLDKYKDKCITRISIRPNAVLLYTGLHEYIAEKNPKYLLECVDPFDTNIYTIDELGLPHEVQWLGGLMYTIIPSSDL